MMHAGRPVPFVFFVVPLVFPVIVARGRGNEAASCAVAWSVAAADPVVFSLRRGGARGWEWGTGGGVGVVVWWWRGRRRWWWWV